MTRAPAPLEIPGYAALSMLGLYMLYEGTTHQTIAVLIGGAVSFTVGLTGLVFVIRSALSHRRMLRRSSLDQKIDVE
jgi:hypothetical protein